MQDQYIQTLWWGVYSILSILVTSGFNFMEQKWHTSSSCLFCSFPVKSEEYLAALSEVNFSCNVSIIWFSKDPFIWDSFSICFRAVVSSVKRTARSLKRNKLYNLVQEIILPWNSSEHNSKQINNKLVKCCRILPCIGVDLLKCRACSLCKMKFHFARGFWLRLNVAKICLAKKSQSDARKK